MNASKFTIIVYKEGEDVDMGETKPLLRKIADLATEAGFKADIELQQIDVEKSETTETGQEQPKTDS